MNVLNGKDAEHYLTWTNMTGVCPVGKLPSIDELVDKDNLAPITPVATDEMLVCDASDNGTIKIITVQDILDLNTLTDDSVTNAKLANMPAATLKGNGTGSPDDPKDLTVAEVKTLLAYVLDNLDDVSAAAPNDGDVLVYNSLLSAWQSQAPAPATVSATRIEQNLGSSPTWRGKFTVVDAAISPTSKIQIWQAFAALTGKGTRADENEMDRLQVAAEAGSGQMTVYWETAPMFAYPRKRSTANFAGRPNTALQAQDDLSARLTPVRIGRVKGNFKFDYLVG